MEIQDFKKLAQNYFELLNITDWKIELDFTYAKYGSCSYRRKVIMISAYHLQHSTDEEIKDTLIHEIAHVLAGKQHCYNHSRLWKVIVVALGGQDKVCGSAPMPNAAQRKEIREKLSKPVFKLEL